MSHSSRQFNKSETATLAGTKLTTPEGIMHKCDFCADLLLEGGIPQCVAACASGVIYFGDQLQDTVSNGIETVSFSALIASRSGYRHLEELGTKPSVYYLPPLSETSDLHP